jgi:hypothetical protein
MSFKKTARDQRIGASGDLDGLKIFIDAKAFLETESQRAFTGAAAGEQGSVDIEKHEFSVHASGLGKSPARREPA